MSSSITAQNPPLATKFKSLKYFPIRFGLVDRIAALKRLKEKNLMTGLGSTHKDAPTENNEHEHFTTSTCVFDYENKFLLKTFEACSKSLISVLLHHYLTRDALLNKHLTIRPQWVVKALFASGRANARSYVCYPSPGQRAKQRWN